MKKVIVFTALVMTGIFLFSGTAMSWDTLISNDQSYIKEPGDVSIDGTVMWRTASQSYDSSSNAKDMSDDMTYMSIPLKGNYGINEFVQTFALVQITSNNDGIDNEIGLGDLWIGAKWAVKPDGLFTIRGALDIPIGDDKKNLGNPGGFGLDAGFMTGIQNIRSINLNGQFGLRYNAEDPDTNFEPGICVYLDGNASYDLTEKFNGNIGLEFMNWAEGKVNNQTAKSSEINWLEVSIGTGYKFNNTISLFADLTYDIMGKHTPVSTGIILGFVYGY